VFPPKALNNLISDLGEHAPKLRSISITDILDNSLIRRLQDEGFIDRLYHQKR
jgi:hypothetical protein